MKKETQRFIANEKLTDDGSEREFSMINDSYCTYRTNSLELWLR